MREVSPTPAKTLRHARATALAAGLHYVYVGNVHDAKHQSTYCDVCGKLVIERDWYQLGAYHLRQAACGHCGNQLAGRFAESPGDWGRKRQPVKISDYASRKENYERGSAMKTATANAMDATHEQAVIRAASEMVAAAAYKATIGLTDGTIAGLASKSV